MNYTQRKFTLPSSSLKTSERRWDYCFLDKEKFLTKYGQDAEEYAEPKSGTE